MSKKFNLLDVEKVNLRTLQVSGKFANKVFPLKI